MRTALLLLLAVLFSFTTLSAAIRTVSNRPEIKAQYTTISDAMSAAGTGDVILVQPSPTSYGTINITKSVTISGGGYNPDVPISQSGYNVTVGNIYNTGSVDNVTIEGLYSTGTIYPTDQSWYTRNWVIRKCNVYIIYTCYSGYYSQYTENWNIYNCIIRNVISINNSGKHTIQNNIFYGSGVAINNSNQNNVTIRNNVFVGCTNCDAFSSVSYATINNNIFFGKAPTGCSYSGFNNNITYQTNANTLPYGTNIGSNNKNNTNPVFVAAPSRDIFTYSYNYNLQSTSPGRNAGTDSTDIGIYGGAFPWQKHKNGSPDYSGQTNAPMIKSYTILNQVLNKNGYLKFNATAAKKD